MPDAATVLWIAGALGTVLLGVATWAWGHTHKRIDDAWKEIDQKAENEELTRVRDTQNKVFEQFREHDKDDRDRHTQLIHTMGRLEGKVDGLLMRDRKEDQRG